MSKCIQIIKESHNLAEWSRQVLPEEQRKGSTTAIGLDYCGKLYAIEKKMKDESPKDKLKERKKQVKLLLETFFV